MTTITAPDCSTQCALSPTQLAERTEEVRQLNDRFLRAHRRTDRVLTLTYSPEAAVQVRALVQRETVCCPFLRFVVRESPHEVELRIEAPPRVGNTTDDVLAPFVPRGNRTAGMTAGISAAAVLACGVCCVVPFALPAVALTGVGGVAAVFARFYGMGVILATAVAALGWAWIGWTAMRTRRRPGSSTLRAMSAATLVLGAALGWPLVEPFVIAGLTALRK